MGHLWKIAMLTYWMNGFTKMFHRWWLRTLWKVLPNSYTEPGRKRMIFACCYTYSLYENTKKKDSPYSSFLMFSIPKKNQKAEMKGNNPSFPHHFPHVFCDFSGQKNPKLSLRLRRRSPALSFWEETAERWQRWQCLPGESVKPWWNRLKPLSYYQWIGFVGKILTGNQWVFTIKFDGLSCKFSHHPVLWYYYKYSLFSMSSPRHENVTRNN